MPPPPPPPSFLTPTNMAAVRPLPGPPEPPPAVIIPATHLPAPVVAAPPPPPPATMSNVIIAAPTVYSAPPLRKNAAAVVPVVAGPAFPAQSVSVIPMPVVPVADSNKAETLKETKSKSSKQSSHKSSEKQKSSDRSAEKTKAVEKSAPAGSEEAGSAKKRRKEKRLLRTAGQQTWEDSSLNEWDADDFRLFCGDLGNDVTDEVLIRVFGKFPSFLKAKVVRDKRSNKSKGYGFVSFKDPQDFIKAMREINGKYVGSRPIKLRKSTWRERNVDMVRKKTKERERLGLI